MSRLDTSPAPPPASGPPTQTGGQPLWPTVIGVLSMVLGGLAILSPEAGGPWWVRLLLSSLQGQSIGWPDAIEETILLGVHGLRAAAAVLLVLAGYLLCRRRRGAALHVVYALVTIPCLIALPLLPLWAYWSYRADIGYVLLYRYLGRVLPGLGHAIFLLVWFRRRKARQQLDAWRRGPAGAVAARPAGSVWPTVLGVLSMALGGLGLFSNLWNSASFLMIKLFRVGGIFVWEGLYVAYYLASAAAGLLLLFAGRLLRRRRPSGATCHIIYAVSEALIVISLPVLAVTVARLASGLPLQALYSILASSSARAFLGIIYPVFLFVWFLRPKIRSQVEAWSQAGRQTELLSPDK